MQTAETIPCPACKERTALDIHRFSQPSDRKAAAKEVKCHNPKCLLRQEVKS